MEAYRGAEITQINNKMEYDFETWFDLYKERLHQLGWRGPIDRDSAEIDYRSGETYDKAAKSLYEELTQ